jgi:hypothetical protein
MTREPRKKGTSGAAAAKKRLRSLVHVLCCAPIRAAPRSALKS